MGHVCRLTIELLIMSMFFIINANIEDEICQRKMEIITINYDDFLKFKKEIHCRYFDGNGLLHCQTNTKKI